MKKLILIFALLLVLPSVMASTPNFEMNKLFDTEVLNGDIDLGNLLFIEKDYTSDTYELTEVSDLQVQRYDILEWNGDSVRLTAPDESEQILVSGSEYYFTRKGVHYLTSMVNSSDTAIINVNPEDEIFVDIDDIDVPIGFDLILTPMNFILEDERVVEANLIVDDDVEPDDYQFSYKVNDVVYSHDFEVLENINWSVDTGNFSNNITVASGNTIYVGRIIVENEGNKDVELTIEKDGNETGILSIPQGQTLYRKNIISLDFTIQVPTVLKSGDYDLEITISGGGLTKIIPLNVTVTDAINPTIDSINFSSNNVFVENTITVYATDNNDVKNLTVNFDDQTYLLEKDANMFTRTFTFTKISRYVMTFCAEDNEGNKVCEQINKTFEKVDIVEGAEKVMNMNAIKFGKYSNMFLFNITDNLTEEIVIELVDVDSVPSLKNDSIIFRVVDEDGSVKTFSKYDNQITISEPGSYYFEVRADEECDVDGLLRINIPDQYTEVSDITFKVSFKDYEVPEDFVISWVNGRDMVCEVDDTGNLETSVYNCMLTYPIDTRAEDISVPTTVAERDNFENEANKVREELANVKSKNAWVLGIVFGLLVIVVLIGVYLFMWHPYIRMQTGKTADERKL